MTDIQAITSALAETGKSRILVLGDYALDKYLYIDPQRDEPSIETGLTAYQIHAKRMSAGAGGNVVSNLCALGADVTCISLVGNDGEGYELLRCLNSIGANTEWMVRTDELCTCTYTKPMRLQEDGSWKEMNRLDFRNFDPPSMGLQQQLVENLKACLPNVDAVLLVDQFAQRNLGTITDYVREQVNQLAKQHPEVIFFVDSRAFSGEFRNMIVKCNNHELMAMAGGNGNPENPEELRLQAQVLSKKNNASFVVTRGSKGMMILEDNHLFSVDGVKVTGPLDIVGAGDSASAGFVLGLTRGLTVTQAAMVGCCVSSITIQQIGTTGTASVPQVLNRLTQYLAGETVS